VSKNYYQEELDQIDLGDTPPKIKIIGATTETKWMDINNESIRVLTRWLFDQAE
jgi:hypothetical protein